MPKAFPHSLVVDGETVGFSVKKFDGDTYIACFRDKEGRRLKLDTRQTRIAQAVETARRLIEKTLAPKTLQSTVTWDYTREMLKGRMATLGNRSSTFEYYLKIIRGISNGTAGPADITEEKAKAWRDRMMTTPGRRKRLPSPHYVAGVIVGLRALWQKWFIDELKLVKENPWRNVEPPKADKLPIRYATDEQIEHFYTWIAERFGDWPFPKLFLAVKAQHWLQVDGPVLAQIRPAGTRTFCIPSEPDQGAEGTIRADAR